MRFVRSLLTLVLAGVSVPAYAATEFSSSKVKFGSTPKGPYYGRQDGIGFDAVNKGPLLVIDGSVDRAFESSLYCNVRQDFLGLTIIHDVDSADGDQGIWAQQATATAIGAARADYDDGVWRLTTDNGNEVGDATLYWGDEQNIDSDKGFIGVWRIMPTLNAAADTVAWGFYGAYNALVDSTTNNAYFTIAGADLRLEITSDDNTTDTGSKDTGVDLTAGTMYEFMICGNALCGGSATNTKFFYRTALGGDWTALLPLTTFSIGADVAIQPFEHVQKTSGTSTPVLDSDYVSVSWQRS